jgi:hypothetical protein
MLTTVTRSGLCRLERFISLPRIEDTAFARMPDRAR